MRFKLKARINRSDERTIRHALEQLGANAEVNKVRDAFAVAAEIEGTSAEELNKNLLTTLRSVRGRTKLRAEWTSGYEITETYFDHRPILENFKLFALLYLNDWCEKDRDFVGKLSSTTSKIEVRLRHFRDAARRAERFQSLRKLPQ